MERVDIDVNNNYISSSLVAKCIAEHMGRDLYAALYRVRFQQIGNALLSADLSEQLHMSVNQYE